MAWKVQTTCQQCGRKLSKKDRELGRICTPCVTGRKTKIFDDSDDSYTEGE